MNRVVLPVVAVLMVAAVLVVQLVHGGGRYEPLRPADPCRERTVDSQAEGIEALTERLVLIGVDSAACELGVSREALVLELAQQEEPTDAQVDALRSGLLGAVERLAGDGTLPPVSELLDEALDQADLNGLLESLIRALPASVVDGALSTEDVLTRAIEDLDLREVLADLTDQGALEQQVEAAVTRAVRDVLTDQVRDLVPGV